MFLFQSSNTHHPLANSRISRVQLSIPNVEQAVAFWKSKGGSLRVHRTADDDCAMVEFGEDSWFCGLCLELHQMESRDIELGIALGHIDVGLPKPNLSSNRETSKAHDTEPNGIVIGSCDGTPGNHFSRVCLRTNNLESSARVSHGFGHHDDRGER